MGVPPFVELSEEGGVGAAFEAVKMVIKEDTLEAFDSVEVLELRLELRGVRNYTRATGLALRRIFSTVVVNPMAVDRSVDFGTIRTSNLTRD